MRASAVVAALGNEPSAEKVFEAFEELDELAPEVVRQELAAWLGPSSDPEALDDATRRAHKMPPRALRLAIVSVTRDADLFDLGDVAEEQLRLTGKAWDGQDLAPEERLDGEIEGSFAGSLEHRVLADASDKAARPLYDLVLHDGGNGIVFHAGTTRVAAMLADGVVETRDARARAALAENLATTPGAASAEPAAFSREAEPEGIEADASEAQTAEVETVEAERAEAETAEVETVEVENAEAEEPAKPKKRAAAARKPAATAERAPGKKATAKKVAAATAKRAAGKKTAAKATSTTKATATRAPKKTAAKTVKTKD